MTITSSDPLFHVYLIHISHREVVKRIADQMFTLLLNVYLIIYNTQSSDWRVSLANDEGALYNINKKNNNKTTSVVNEANGARRLIVLSPAFGGGTTLHL